MDLPYPRSPSSGCRPPPRLCIPIRSGLQAGCRPADIATPLAARRFLSLCLMYNDCSASPSMLADYPLARLDLLFAFRYPSPCFSCALSVWFGWSRVLASDDGLHTRDALTPLVYLLRYRHFIRSSEVLMQCPCRVTRYCCDYPCLGTATYSSLVWYVLAAIHVDRQCRGNMSRQKGGIDRRPKAWLMVRALVPCKDSCLRHAVKRIYPGPRHYTCRTAKSGLPDYLTQ